MFVNPIRTALTNLKNRFARRKPVPPPPPVASVKPKIEHKEVKFDLKSLLPPVDHGPYNQPHHLERAKANRSRAHRQRMKKVHKRNRRMNAQYRRRS